MSAPRTIATMLIASIAACAHAGPDLLQAHLNQVERLRRTAPAQTPALTEVRREVERRSREWNRRVPAVRPVAAARGTATAGLPRGLIERAGAASDAAAKNLLSKQASLSLVLALVARRNPDARASYEAWRATLRQFEQATFLEDSLSQFRAFTRELDTKVGPQTQREMPEKTFAWPSAMALRGQLVDVAARLGEVRYEQTLRKALNDAARSFFQVQYATRSIELTVENRKLFADMDTLTRAQLQVGAVSQADSLKTQSTLAALDNQIGVLEIERTSEVARASALMGLPVDSAWGPLPPVDLIDREAPLAALIVRAESGNQELAMATLDVEQMATMIRMAETMAFPRGSFGASAIAPSVGAEAGPTRGAMATFPDRPAVDATRAGIGANAAYIDELRVRLVQARRNRDAVRARIAQMVQEAHARVAVARRTYRTYAEEVAPRAKQAFATMRERYNTARAPFIEFLDAGRTYLDAVIKSEEARRDRNRALLDLQDALGEGPGVLLPR